MGTDPTVATLSVAADPTAPSWVWRAHYADDGSSYLDEYAGDGTRRGFAMIDQARLRVFELRPNVAGVPPVLLKLGGDLRLIFYRTHVAALDLNDGRQKPLGAVTVAGWQRTVNGRNVQSLTACYPNGSILCVDDRSKIEGL